MSTPAKLSKLSYSQLWKSTKGKQQSKEKLFKKTAQAAVRKVGFVECNLPSVPAPSSAPWKP
jgi:hypothetical protein